MTTDSYPVRTLRAPWGHLIVFGGKDVECRSQPTSYRGWFWVHQGLQIDLEGEHLVAASALTLGAIIGAARIVDCVQDWHSAWAVPGTYHWVLEDRVYLPDPLRLRGKQNWWYDAATLSLPDPASLHAAPRALAVPDATARRAGRAGTPPAAPRTVTPPRIGGAVMSPDTGRKAR